MRDRLQIELHHSFFSPVLGGQERRMHALAGEFLRRPCEVVVCAPANGVDDPRAYEAKGMRLLLHPPFFTRVPKSLLDPLLYIRRLESFHRRRTELAAPDLVLCFQYSYAAAAKRAWPGVPVLWLAGAAAWDWHGSLYGHRGPLARCLLFVRRLAALAAERQAVNAADRIFVESEFLRDRLRRFHPRSANKIRIQRAPIDTGRFCPSGERRRECRAELGIPESAGVILGVGRLDANKNFGMLIEAVARLKTPDWRLLIAGAGAEGKRLEELARAAGAAGRVSFLGARPDIERFYSAADVYVHPSVLESYSNAMLEAMASGLAILVSKTVSRDLEDGRHALLADPADPADWTAKLDRLLADRGLAAQLGAEARAFCERRPGWPQLAGLLLQELPAANREGAGKNG